MENAPVNMKSYTNLYPYFWEISDSAHTRIGKTIGKK